MRIPSFEVKNARGIQLAKWDAVPKLMIIAGPNGAGKSTLLSVEIAHHRSLKEIDDIRAKKTEKRELPWKGRNRPFLQKPSPPNSFIQECIQI
jgi:AAA15 family ATPase/GTPase